MNPFFLSPQERLADWKQFRQNLKNFSDEEALFLVAQYWAKAPLLKHSHDIEEASSLPTPWEMISEGNWCRNSIAIGMEFTLRLAGWDAKRLRLSMLRDRDISEVILVLIIDDSKVLNYTYGEVIDYPATDHDVIGQWAFSGKFYTRANAVNIPS